MGWVTATETLRNVSCLPASHQPAPMPGSHANIAVRIASATFPGNVEDNRKFLGAAFFQKDGVLSKPFGKSFTRNFFDGMSQGSSFGRLLKRPCGCGLSHILPDVRDVHGSCMEGIMWRMRPFS
ncbi:hypothetical protein [Novacetimonas cocois]|uniref:hypothetical protein n=1 Tax=Novacetimonas cocois TaxID=1747507 RepID=UPI0014021ED1|nr:hypothetical protein [Novacetimonas cocois]